MVAKSDPRLGFRAVLDSTIALAVWLQIELAEPWQPWLADIRSRLGNIMRADALGNRWPAKRLSGFLTKICIGFLISRCAILVTIIWCRKPATGAMRRYSICYAPKCGKPKP
ncbi:hypothetical protein ECZU20_02360 [Escherichia coli]|nr:hypothetical protein ECZU03_05130 [Escherichia coli]GHK95486.1 hypothetical protein ECZU20_02360 [Escherichia coli]GHM30817.1 hypothetical protein ECZU45_46040 [Escherichia coli]